MSLPARDGKPEPENTTFKTNSHIIKKNENKTKTKTKKLTATAIVSLGSSLHSRSFPKSQY